MQNPIMDSLFLVDVSGHIIIAVIVVALLAGIITNLALRIRYASIERELLLNPTAKGTFSHALLERIVHLARDASRQQSVTSNAQAIVEESFQAELRGALLGERYVRSSTGLMIILGLIGTFYGLTSSIGKLVNLITAEAPTGADVGQLLTEGLSEALAGMSVAFTTSLFGIVAAIVMMLFSIFSNVADRRTALMVRIEAYVDKLFPVQGPNDKRLESALAGFKQSVLQLDHVVERFDTALQTFSSTTRDFHEFNLHLKDNVQRMSLGFGDFAEAMKVQVGALKAQEKAGRS